jgi:cytochrome c556
MLNQLPLLALLGLAACQDEPDFPPLADFPVPPLRHVMFEVDALHRAIEPIQRDETQTAAIASMARSMQKWIADPSWSEYQQSEHFFGDPSQFNEYLGTLIQGTNELSTAAEAGDLMGIRKGFTLTNQSCIACHKRFQPNI